MNADQIGVIVLIVIVIFSIVFSMVHDKKKEVILHEPIDLKDKSTEELKEMLDQLSNQLSNQLDNTNMQQIMSLLQAVQTELIQRGE